MKARLSFDTPKLGGVAEAIATKIREAIVAAPGNRWNKTGALLRSIDVKTHADGSADVIVAGDRLNRPELAETFKKEIVGKNLLRDGRVRDAIALSVAKATRVEVTDE